MTAKVMEKADDGRRYYGPSGILRLRQQTSAACSSGCPFQRLARDPSRTAPSGCAAPSRMRTVTTGTPCTQRSKGHRGRRRHAPIRGPVRWPCRLRASHSPTATEQPRLRDAGVASPSRQPEPSQAARGAFNGLYVQRHVANASCKQPTQTKWRRSHGNARGAVSAHHSRQVGRRRQSPAALTTGVKRSLPRHGAASDNHLPIRTSDSLPPLPPPPRTDHVRGCLPTMPISENEKKRKTAAEYAGAPKEAHRWW